MPNEDAYSYCVSACWEPYIVGKSLDQNNIMVFDYFKALDAVLNNGVEYRSIEELVESYIKENGKCFKEFLQSVDEMKWAKDPLVSILWMAALKREKMYPKALPNTTTMALRQLRFPMWWIVCSISKNWYSRIRNTHLPR